ncbi:hypothetical protein GF340_04425, partial [Candidatus Peregrinibacteria bacterium]|nr:hypothetical protein [Candidatus Peregrinibacteria bacterium]
MPPAMKPKNNKPGSNFIYLIIIALAAAGLFLIMNPGDGNVKKVPLDEFLQEAKSGEIAEIQVEDNRINYTLIDDTEKYTFKEQEETVGNLLEDLPDDIRNEISIEVVPTDGQRFWMDLL